MRVLRDAGAEVCLLLERLFGLAWLRIQDTQGDGSFPIDYQAER